jgi:hypothetical protein
MSDVSLANDLLVWIPEHLPSRSAVPLRLQFCEDKLTMTVSPGADTMGPEAVRAVIDAMCHYFEQHKIMHRVTSQGLEGTRRDTVIIPLPRRC